MIKSRCPNCEALLGFDDHLAGHQVRCPRCKVTMTVLPPEAKPARPHSPRPEIHVTKVAPQRVAAAAGVSGDPGPDPGGRANGGKADAGVTESDPLAAIAQAEAEVVPHAHPHQHHGGGDDQHHHHAHHHHPRLPHHRRNKHATLVLVIGFLMIAAFGIGFFTGSSYRNFALSDAGRLLPPDTTLDDFVPAPPKATRSAFAGAEDDTPKSFKPAAASATPRAINTPTSPAPQVRTDTNARRYAIVFVGFGGYQDDAGRSRIQFWLSNSTDKQIANVKGRVQVFDENDQHLGDLELIYRDGIPEGGNAVATDSWKLPSDVVERFANEPKKLRYKFETDTVAYANGESETFE